MITHRITEAQKVHNHIFTERLDQRLIVCCMLGLKYTIVSLNHFFGRLVAETCVEFGTYSYQVFSLCWLFCEEKVRFRAQGP